MFLRLANQHQEFVKDLVMCLQALATVLERRGYEAACYTCGERMNSANFMVSLAPNHLIRFLVSDYGITWTELRDDRELMKHNLGAMLDSVTAFLDLGELRSFTTSEYLLKT